MKLLMLIGALLTAWWFWFNGTGLKTEDPLVRTTSSGVLLGLDHQTHNSWLGIPYAKSTAGPYRWKAPQPYIADRLLKAHHYGDPCAQPAMVIENHTLTEMRYTGSENCLFLNIWAPQQQHADTTPIPVIVWVHGGANVVGNGNINGGKLASSQRVIVVSINYRLGIFGWLSHSSLRNTAASPEEASGNFGTLDIIESLKWVRHNISRFGGDPNNVTLMGLSAGGWNVFSLLQSPMAKGLFHKAIIHSGQPRTSSKASAEHLIDNATSGHPQSSGELLLQLIINEGLAADRRSAKVTVMEMGDTNIVEYLRSKSHQQLELALNQLAQQYNQRLGDNKNNNSQRIKRIFRRHSPDAPYLNYQAPMLFTDGTVLSREDFMTSIEQGVFNLVPMILGTTRDESKNFQVLDPEFVSIKNGKRLINGPVRYQLANHSISQLWKRVGADKPATALADLVDVFVFRFDWDELPDDQAGENLKALYGASHGIDQGFIFGEQTTPFSDKPLTVEDQKLSAAIMNYWAEFAYSGKPSKGRSGQLPEWTPWSNASGSQSKTLLLDREGDKGIRMSGTHITSKDIAELFAKESTDNTVYCDISNNPIIDLSIANQEILKLVDCERKNSE